MVRESYKRQLEELLQAVSEMGREVMKSLGLGLQAIRDHDAKLAEGLNVCDDGIDQLYLDIEKKCTDLLALQQPVAVDLRLIVSVFKIVTDLERAADLAVNLGEYALASEAFIVMPKDELLELGEFACEMLEDSLKAFRNRDVERAREVIERDRQMDQRFWNLRTHVLTQLIKSSSACPTAEEAQLIAKNTITVLWSIRDLERVGDHAVNICARTIYWVSASAEYI